MISFRNSVYYSKKHARKFASCIAAVFLASTFVPVSADVDAPLSIEQAIALALAPNSGLAQMRSRADAAAATPSQQGALPDPRLHINFINLPIDSFSLSQEPMTQMQLGFSQALPFPGKLAAKEGAASAKANATRFEVEEFRLRLVRDVKNAWWQLLFLDKSLETIDKNRLLLRQLVSTAQTKYSVGQGLQQDVLLAQLELSKLTEKELDLSSLRQSVVARLNAYMERPTYQSISLASVDKGVIPKLKNVVELQRLSHSIRPLLQAQQAKIEAAEKQLKFAKMEVLPDFTLGANYGYRSGKTDMTSVQFSMSLPLYAAKKQNRKTDQRQSELLAAKHALGDIQQKTSADIQMLFARHEESTKLLALFDEDIIPQAKQTVDSMMAAYQVNKIDFDKLVRAQTTLYNYETQYWNAYSRAQQTLAGLEAAVGQESIYE